MREPVPSNSICRLSGHSGRPALGGAVGTHMQALAQAHILDPMKIGSPRRRATMASSTWPAGWLPTWCT